MAENEAVGTVQGIIKALSMYATPQSVTTQIIGRVVSSNKTKSLVRKVLIDPIQSKFVPKIEATGYDRCREVFNALMDIFPDKELVDILDITEADAKMYREMMDESPFYTFNSWFYDVSDNGNVSKLIHVMDALVYIQIAFPKNDGRYRSGAMTWTLEFISPTKKVYELFVDKIEAARQYMETGYMKKFQRRIKVIQMGRGRRGYQVSYATVPNTVIISSDIRNDLETVIRSVERADDIKKAYEVNKTIGVLLHGPAGTGKSTIVRYLAMRLGRTLILTGAGSLNEVIDYTKDNSHGDQKFIILIEDIDFKFVDRRKLKNLDKKETETKDDDDSDLDGPFSFGGAYAETDTLFQLLDGVLGDSNLMVCATTNYKDRLDPALIRDGRFDHDIEVLGLSYEDACDVCKSFEVTPDDVNLSSLELPINPATLQTLILKFKTTAQ